jgi:hypothetical protein
MQIQFHLGVNQDAIGDKFGANTSHLPSSAVVTVGHRQLKYDAEYGVFFWEVVGIIDIVPAVLHGLPIERVVIRQRTARESDRTWFQVGEYRIPGARAFVEHSSSDQGRSDHMLQYTTIIGNTLESALLILGLLQERQVERYVPEAPPVPRRSLLLFATDKALLLLTDRFFGPLDTRSQKLVGDYIASKYGSDPKPDPAPSLLDCALALSHPFKLTHIWQNLSRAVAAFRQSSSRA